MKHLRLIGIIAIAVITWAYALSREPRYISPEPVNLASEGNPSAKEESCQCKKE